MSPRAHWTRASDLLHLVEKDVANSGTARHRDYACLGAAGVHALMAGIGCWFGRSIWDDTLDSPSQRVQDS